MEIKPLELIKKHKKKVLILSIITKIPLMLYIIWILSTVPTIDAINPDYEVIKGAHRGDSVECIENTFNALKNATDKDEYEFVEFDIQYTKDRQIVVYHDIALLRLEGKSDQIENLTYDELQELSSFPIPTYQEVMDYVGGKKKLDIEIKSQGNTEDDKELLNFVIRDVTERGILDKIMISSVSDDVIIYSKEKYPDIKTGKIYWIHNSTFLPFDFLTHELYKDLEQMDADYVFLHGSNIHNMSDLIEQKPEDVTLAFWYFNDQMYLVQVDENDGMW